MSCHQWKSHHPSIIEKAPFFHSSFSHFALATDLAKLSCLSQFQTCLAHVSDLPVFQSPHDLFPIFAASRYEAWLEETALNFLTPCLFQTDWFDTYSIITHSDPRHTGHTAASWHDTQHHQHGKGTHCAWWGGIATGFVKSPPKTNRRQIGFWIMSEKKMGGDRELNIGLLLGFPRENIYDSPQSLVCRKNESQHWKMSSAEASISEEFKGILGLWWSLASLL